MLSYSRRILTDTGRKYAIFDFGFGEYLYAEQSFSFLI